jgi:hypothetical protein
MFAIARLFLFEGATGNDGGQLHGADADDSRHNDLRKIFVVVPLGTQCEISKMNFSNKLHVGITDSAPEGATTKQTFIF